MNATAKKITAHNVTTPAQVKPPMKRANSGVQFKAVQKAVEAIVSESIAPAVKEAVVNSAVYGIKPGERKELMLQVESEKILDARHVQVKFVDGGNRRYVWSGTTGQAARLQPGQVVLMKASAVGFGNDGMEIKHCRLLEVAS